MRFKDFLEAKYTDYSNPFKPYKWELHPGPKKKLAGKFIVLGKDETFAYVWSSENNLMPWEKVLEKARKVVSTSRWQRSDTDILLTPDGNIILDRATDDTRWPGVRNQYTKEVPKIVKELLKRKIIQKTAKIYSGNWAGQRGQLLGTAEEILQSPEMPEHFVLYHGTNNFRAEEILEQGLKAMPVHQRMWRGRADRGHPAYRDEAVYLTAASSQAVTYAEKAVRIARNQGIRRSYPVILKIIINKNDYDKLRADDDYLEKTKDDPKNWRESLSFFGQVAFIGTIPPNQISFYKKLEGRATEEEPVE